MRYLMFAVAALAVLCAFQPATESPVLAQDAADTSAKVRDHVARARRLREFGMPLLAKDQLELARKLSPTDKPLLLEYLRLYTQPGGIASDDQDFQKRESWTIVKPLVDGDPQDYETCYELANWLFQTAVPGLPPNVRNPEQLAAAFDRLAAEMIVFRQLATYIAKPVGDLPAAAKGKPGLSLAFLARAAKASPGTMKVSELAAYELSLRGHEFERWGRTDEALKPFAAAAQELYDLTLPLLRQLMASPEHGAAARIETCGLLVRLGRRAEAKQEIAAAELLSPTSLTLAGMSLEIAESEDDGAAVIEALEKMHAIQADTSSHLNLLAARRIAAKQWPFSRWIAWRELNSQGGLDYIASLQAMIKTMPDFLELFYLESRVSLELALADSSIDGSKQKLDHCLKALDKCKELEPVFADWSGISAAAYWHLGRYADAAKAYDQVTRLDPGDSSAAGYARAARDIEARLYSAWDWLLYEDVFNRNSDFREKQKTLAEILQRSPKFYEAQRLHGIVCFRLGAFNIAYDSYAAALALRPGTDELLEGAARSAMNCQKYDAAAKHFAALHELRKQPGSQYWASLLHEVASGTDARRGAFKLWLEAELPDQDPASRKRMLEEAIATDPDFTEPLLKLGQQLSGTDPARAETLLKRARRNCRCDFGRAEAHIALGRLYFQQQLFAKATSEFETAYTLDRGDGVALLLSGICLHEIGEERQAGAAMRKLFTENPSSPLLRPTLDMVHNLNLVPAASGGVLSLHPAYSAGDKLAFTVNFTVTGEGGGREVRNLSLQYGMNITVEEAPSANGLWQLKIAFSDVPPEFGALAMLETVVKISPWFGLLAATELGALSEIVNPAIQALCEGFTLGLGDAPVASPYVWRNDMTKGPAHFARDNPEGAFLAETMGDSHKVIRRAAAGRRANPEATQHNFSRWLEARVSVGGAKRAIQSAEYQINMRELTKERDDVILSDFKVTLTAK